MKIGIYITDITRGAGTERVAVSVANHLAEKGHQVTIISFNTKTGNPFYDVTPAVRIYHLGLNSYMNRSVCYKWYSYFRNLLTAYFEMKRFRFDVIVGTSRNVNVLALMYRHKKQIVWGCEHFSCNAPLVGILRLFRNWAYRFLDELIVLTEVDCIYYKNKGIKACLVPNALPFEPMSSVNRKEKIVLAIGRHSKEKAFDKLIRIWSKTKCKDSGWKLYIIGNGDLRGYNYRIVEDLHLKDSVEFIDPTPEIRQYYISSSIYAMTSLYEALPMVLLEAKANEIPLVSYDCETGPKVIVKNNKDGFLIPFDNEKEFVRKLDLLAGNTALRMKMGKAALEDSYNYTQGKIMLLWDELLSKYDR